jgi:F-type H+-transporting ATPase subunit b
MHFDWWTFGLQTVNFAVLVWLLHRFLYKPVLRMIDARRAEVEKQYADAGAAEAKARSELAAIAAERANMASEHDALFKAAVAHSDDMAKARRAQADAEAAKILDHARKTIAAERGEALTEARNAAFDLGVKVALKLLAEIPQKLRGEAWLERIEQHLAALPSPEREALVGQIEAGEGLAVLTASALTPDMTETWRGRLRRLLGEDLAISFAADPDLVAGAELHFPNAILRFSWQSALAAARSEVEA